MVLPRSLLVACVLGGALVPARALAACEGARLGGPEGDVPEAWRRALVALMESTETPGAPWSCVPAVVWLELHGAGATLIVQPRDAGAVRREVDEPDDVVPLGQALLAVPLEPTPPPPDPTPRAEAPPEAPLGAPVSPPLSPPRVLLSALVSPRYAGKTGIFWLGAQLDASLPFGAWSVGGWGRFDAIRLTSSDRAANLDEGVLGLSAGRDFGLRSLVLRPSIRPSLALVSGDGRSQGGATEVFGRVGAELRLLVPFTRDLRGLVTLDGELSPSALDDPPPATADDADGDGAERRADPIYPGFTVGLGLGVELAIR